MTPPESLRRRLIVQLELMIVGLFLLSAAAIVGINGLHSDYGVALRGYRQLREVFEIGQSLSTARASLPDHVSARQAMHSARLRMETSREISESDALRAAVARAAGELTPEAMDAALGEVARMSAEIRQTVTAAQEAALGKRRLTLAVVIGLSMLVIGGGVWVGVQQYRAVMLPLRRLGDAVREVAGGNFSKPIEETGDREFFELSRDFNRMSAELGALYRDLEQKVRDKSKELVRSERLASVGYLAAGVAHEINNPLGIITGYGERALRQMDAEGGGSERARKAIAVMCEEAYRCKQITDRLLSLARGGSESFGPVELATVAEEVIANLTALPEYRDRRIVLEADHRSPLVVRGRDGEMKQVILNLLINALQAEPSPNPLPEYRERGTRVTVSRLNEMVELSVLDHGRGMDSAALDRIFEPFFTSKRGEGRGTGLGLSITHAIVTDHGGTIAAYSEGAGRGSRFVVRLPAMQGVEHVKR